MRDENLTIDLSAPTRLADLPELAGRFLTWWKNELLAMSPWASSAQPARTNQNVTLYVRRNIWFLKSSSADHDPLSLDTNASDGELANEILHASNELPLSRLTVLLPRDQVLMRRIELPQMAESRVRQAVELQIDRLSPFKSDAVRSSARVVERDIVQGTMQVDVAIAPLARIEPIERRLQTLGFAPVGVDVEGEGGAASGFDLRQPPSAESLRSRRNLNLGLAAAAALMWFLALYAWNQASEREVGAWQDRIAELRPAAERSAAVRRRMEAMIEPVAIANVHAPALPLEVLSELTKILPDTVRIVDLRVEGVDVLISGLAGNAPQLIGMLEDSPKFRDVKFVSSVVRRPDSDIERFEISMHIDRAAPP